MAMHVWNTWSEPTPYEDPGDPIIQDVEEVVPATGD